MFAATLRTLTPGLVGVALTASLALAGPPAAQAAPSAQAAPAGTISTVAGGVGGPGPATSVSVTPCGVQNSKTPCGMTCPAASAEITFAGLNLDSHGNLLIPTAAFRVRVVAERDGTLYGVPMTAGDIYTVAGNGTSGYAGDGGPAISAEISAPQDAAATAGPLFIADRDNLRFRQVEG